jgi:hypothetical protein
MILLSEVVAERCKRDLGEPIPCARRPARACSRHRRSHTLVPRLDKATGGG